MVDQRDTLQYMDAPLLCYADKFFDRRATYKVKTVCSRIDACDGRLDGVRISRGIITALSTDRCKGVDGSIFHLR